MTLVELIKSMNSQQAAIVTNLVKTLGILETAQVGTSSDFLKHEYEVVATDPAAAVRAVNGSIIASAGNNILASIQLPEVGLLKELDRAIIEKYGTIEAYFSDPVRTEQYMRVIMQLLDKSMIYGDNPTFGTAGMFKGFHQIAKANGKVVAQLGGASGSRSTAFAVHYIPGENQIVIPKTAGGQLVRAELVADGKLQSVTDNTSTGARKLVKSGYFWANAAFQAGNNFAVAAITQIDSTHKPTAALMDELLDAVKALPDGMTFIYCNRRVRRYIKELKAAKLVIDTSNRNYVTAVGSWDDIPIILDESILDTETTALD